MYFVHVLLCTWIFRDAFWSTGILHVLQSTWLLAYSVKVLFHYMCMYLLVRANTERRNQSDVPCGPSDHIPHVYKPQSDSHGAPSASTHGQFLRRTLLLTSPQELLALNDSLPCRSGTLKMEMCAARVVSCKCFQIFWKARSIIWVAADSDEPGCSYSPEYLDFMWSQMRSKAADLVKLSAWMWYWNPPTKPSRTCRLLLLDRVVCFCFNVR